MLKLSGKHNDKIIFGVIAVIVILVLIFVPLDQTYVGIFMEQFSKVNWDEVSTRNIVKNSIPIIFIEGSKTCKVTAENFHAILDHDYFVRSEELEKELNYDRESETLSLQCNLLKGQKSRLSVWYVVEESPTHSQKYEYFVTAWEERKP